MRNYKYVCPFSGDREGKSRAIGGAVVQLLNWGDIAHPGMVHITWLLEGEVKKIPMLYFFMERFLPYIGKYSQGCCVTDQ